MQLGQLEPTTTGGSGDREAVVTPLRKRPRDLNRLASSVVADATEKKSDEQKDPRFVGTAPAGRVIGASARAAKRSPERGSKMSRTARAARVKEAPDMAQPMTDGSFNVEASEQVRRIQEYRKDPQLRARTRDVVERLRANPNYRKLSDEEFRKSLFE